MSNPRADRKTPLARSAAIGVTGAVLLLPAPASASLDAEALRSRLAQVKAELQRRGDAPPPGYSVPCDGRGGERQAQFQNWPNQTWYNQEFDNWDNWSNY